MYPQSALVVDECLSDERETVVSSIPPFDGAIHLGDVADCRSLSLSLPTSLSSRSMSVMGVLPTVR